MSEVDDSGGTSGTDSIWGSILSHPISGSLREAYDRPIDKARIGAVKEFPGFGLEAVVDGKQLEIGNSKFMNQQGYFYQRVADIGTAVHVAVDGEYAGYILITDVVRKKAGRLLKWLKKQQIEAVMITGDNERVAEDVARQLKLDYVYAGLMPEEKVEQVREFMESHMEDEKLGVCRGWNQRRAGSCTCGYRDCHGGPGLGCSSGGSGYHFDGG
ncbi:HAD family hydrolase [Mediterraneibacter gnavus]|uniref:HAD family hydrolase n=1 Tax=Mediterraneibacter gnavus TaxID=33038 RepID=UPI001FA6B097|nr:HAD family hydrolase [Mediterraneibacter gnavus]